ncbi:MAG: hypothetical protein IPN33_18145 [Saprospiraceae bacterium]|nr:hypothetical protein [Saprospiraceae bacterium]
MTVIALWIIGLVSDIADSFYDTIGRINLGGLRISYIPPDGRCRNPVQFAMQKLQAFFRFHSDLVFIVAHLQFTLVDDRIFKSERKIVSRCRQSSQIDICLCRRHTGLAITGRYNIIE